MSRNNLGIGLATVAGLTTIASAVWPIAPPQGRGDSGAFWGVSMWILGGAFVASAFLADRHTPISKGILFVGSAFILASAFIGQSREDVSLDPSRLLFGLVPAVLGIASGFLIGPVQLTPAERQARDRGTLPKQPVPPEEQVPYREDDVA